MASERYLKSARTKMKYLLVVFLAKVTRSRERILIWSKNKEKNRCAASDKVRRSCRKNTNAKKAASVRLLLRRVDDEAVHPLFFTGEQPSYLLLLLYLHYLAASTLQSSLLLFYHTSELLLFLCPGS